jgi:hypothetical protein
MVNRFWHNIKLSMHFDPMAYGEEAAAVLALDGHGFRPMPLTFEPACPERPDELLSSLQRKGIFEGSRSPLGALSGLWLYFSRFDESHRISQDLHTPEGSFWHAIAHRREPDPGNSAYWFRRVGSHPVFPALLGAASDIVKGRKTPLRLGSAWDPFAFIDYCERARQHSGSEEERIAMEIQLAEWQLLFDYCARPAR